MEKLKGKKPSIRFPEFKGEWEKKKLGEVAKFSKGKGISKSDIVVEGNIECIRYGELYTTYGETIRFVKSKTNIDKDDLVFSEENDVIIPASGETQIDIATASCVLKAGVALGGDLNIIKTKHNGVFLSYYLNNKKKFEIASLAQGISVVHLYASQLSLLLLSFPSLPEQKKIANFLTAVDEKIQALKKKKALLEQYKKGVMQKIFSQELRFKDDNGKAFPKWEKKKLGEIAKFYAGGDLDKLDYSKAKNEKYIYPIYANGMGEGLYGYANTYQFNENCVTVSGRGNLGLAHARTQKFNAIVRLIVIEPETYINSKFLEEAINQIKFAVESTGVPQLTVPQISSYKILIPSLEEQIKIANFLSAIDDKINQTETQIQQMQEWKTGLLQKMFV